MKPTALIIHAPGTNRDHDAAQAVELAGGGAEIVHLNQLRRGERRWRDYQMLVVPGGFSYADALGAGRLLALDLNLYFAAETRAFVEAGKPVIGICNGFQALVKAGILPDPAQTRVARCATLAHNASGRFECRWVHLQPSSQACIWTRGIERLVACPVAHGEGSFTVNDARVLDRLIAQDQVALVYTRPNGARAQGEYPFNPNGSVADIAGICNPQGNVLGLMPHPENHIFSYQYIDKSARTEASGLSIFTNGVAYASQL